MKKVFTFLAFLVIVTGAGFAQQKIVLKVATVAPVRSPWDIELKKLAQEWNTITNGEVSIKFFDMTVLGGEKAGVQRMKSARPGQRPQMDGAIFSAVGLNELAPKAQIFTLSAPFLIQNQQELDMVLDKYGSIFEQEIQKAGCKLLTWSNVGWLAFYTTDSYSSLGSLKKMKIFCANDTKDMTDVLKIHSFNVEAVPPAKFNQALKSAGGQKGFLSVHLLSYVTGVYKDVNYILDARMCPVMAGFVMADESWALIPEKYKPAMLAALEKTRRDLNNNLEKQDAEYLKKMTSEGIKIIPLPQAQKAEWNTEFQAAMPLVYRQLPNVVNVDMYKKITQLLEPYRK